MTEHLDHKHIVVTATGLQKPIHLASELENWLRRLVTAVEMNILIEPQAVRCDTIGNAGVTGIVCIETSHVAAHFWDESVPFMRMDLYSCQNFEIDTVLNMVREFQPTGGSWMLIDRNIDHAILGAGPLVPSRVTT